MVVVTVLHPLGGLLGRRGHDTVNRHLQIEIAVLNQSVNLLDVTAGIGHVLGVIHGGDAVLGFGSFKCQTVGLDEVNGPSVAGTFLKCGETDGLTCGQLEIGQGDHSVDRVAADAEFVVLDERRVIADEDIICGEAVRLAVAPAELNDQVHAERLGQAGGITLIGVGLKAGGRVVVGVEQPMVVVAVLHPLGGVIHRRSGDAVNRHRQVKVAALNLGGDVFDVTTGVGHVLGVID